MRNFSGIRFILIPILLFWVNSGKTQILNPPCPRVGVFLTGLPACNEQPYELVFEDNFDGNSLDLTKWGIQGWSQGALYGNGGLTQEYNSLNNVEVSAGTCKIIAKQENVVEKAINYLDANEILDDGLPNLRPYNYTSANLWSVGENFFHGKYEIRCRMPNGKGFWPSFWIYNGGEDEWHEIDFFEIHTENINRYTCDVHHIYPGYEKASCGYAQEDAADFSEWHTITCYFEYDKISWAIDGEIVRSFYRYETVDAHILTCEDGNDIAIGTYFQQRAYPSKPMYLIFSMGVENGASGPDENTQFPATFEIDYIRYWAKGGCDGCIDHITYSNTNNLPQLTRADNYIKATSSVSVMNGQNINFEAGNSIELDPGFTIQPGGNFNAVIKDCNLSNFVPVPVNYLQSNLIDGYVIDRCADPTYKLETTGALNYHIRVFASNGTLVHEQWGVPNTNQITLWNAYNAANGWYAVELELENCNDEDTRTFNIRVLTLSCRMADTENANLNPTINQPSALKVIPNPTPNSAKLVLDNANPDETYEVFVVDLMGKIVHFETIQNSNNTVFIHPLNLEFLASGYYRVVLIDELGSTFYESLLIEK